VMFNLLDNAIRHTPNGGKVTVATDVKNNKVSVIVGDSGSGIPKAQLPYVWERFYRIDSSRARKSGGTGLGLAIVKQIVEGHHGSVAIQSKEGEGTTVTIQLPISEVD
jgi:two-component system sensor histidine kinase ResE